jgi:hypothetical protein
MESESYRHKISVDIRNEITRRRFGGMVTSKGEPMSMAAIGRTLDPPVSRVTVCQVVSGNAESRRVKEAVERELGRPYWIKKEPRHRSGIAKPASKAAA